MNTFNRIILLFIFLLIPLLSFSQKNVRIFVHVITDTANNKCGPTRESIDKMLCTLSDDFEDANMNTHFIWDGDINVLDDTDLYTKNVVFFPYDDYRKDNGVNIFLLGDAAPNDPSAGGVLDGSSGYIGIEGGKRGDLDILETSVITHEMGHVFGLQHTLIGDTEEGGSKNYMCEGCENGEFWSEFSSRQKTIMNTTLNNNKDILVDEANLDGVDYCGVGSEDPNNPDLPRTCTEDEPDPCEKPDIRDITLTTRNFFGNSRVTIATYAGNPMGYVWEWDIPGLSYGVAQNNAHNWIWWEHPGYPFTIKVRVTNDCGETSDWKDVQIE